MKIVKNQSIGNVYTIFKIGMKKQNITLTSENISWNHIAVIYDSSMKILISRKFEIKIHPVIPKPCEFDPDYKFSSNQMIICTYFLQNWHLVNNILKSFEWCLCTWFEYKQWNPFSSMESNWNRSKFASWRIFRWQILQIKILLSNLNPCTIIWCWVAL